MANPKREPEQNPKQQVSPKGIRILALFVLGYLAVGSHLYFNVHPPTWVYITYGIVSWIAGMLLFYKLHKSYIANLAQ